MSKVIQVGGRKFLRYFTHDLKHLVLESLTDSPKVYEYHYIKDGLPAQIVFYPEINRIFEVNSFTGSLTPHDHVIYTDFIKMVQATFQF